MPNEFWAEAANTSVYVQNCCPTTALNGVTPYECLFEMKARCNKFTGVWIYYICAHSQNLKKESGCKIKKIDFRSIPRRSKRVQII